MAQAQGGATSSSYLMSQQEDHRHFADSQLFSHGAASGAASGSSNSSWRVSEERVYPTKKSHTSGFSVSSAQKRHDWKVMFNALVAFGNEKGHCNGK